MSHNAANSSSLSDRARSMALAPDIKALLVEMAVQVEHAVEAAEMMARAQPAGAPLMAVPEPPAAGPKHKRDRHGLHMLPGGLAALLPVALLGHGFPAGAAALARWLWGSARGRAVASVLAVSTGAAVGIPVAAEQAMGRPAAHPPAAVQSHHRRHHQAGPGLTPAPVLAPAPRRRRRHHRSRPRYGIVLPTPPASPPPSPPPSPVPSPSDSPTPTSPVTPTPGVSPLGQVARRLVPGDLPWWPMLP